MFYSLLNPLHLDPTRQSSVNVAVEWLEMAHFFVRGDFLNAESKSASL